MFRGYEEPQADEELDGEGDFNEEDNDGILGNEAEDTFVGNRFADEFQASPNRSHSFSAHDTPAGGTFEDMYM